MGRIASIDYGLARIGLAISDELKIIARTLEVVLASKKTLESAKAVARALAPFQLDGVIIGLPVHFNGKEGFLADEVRSFISHLAPLLPCPIITWEERLSTKQAEQPLRAAGLSRKKRTAIIDALTACVILQSYLDYLRREIINS